MERAADSSAGTMKLVGGHPVLDFVNTVGGRADGSGHTVLRDKLPAYVDLVAWAEHAGVVSPGEARALLTRARRRPRQAAGVMAAARRLREALYRVLRALLDGVTPAPADLARVSAAVRAGQAAQHLAPGPRGLHWHTPEAGPLESVLWPIGRAASTLLVSDLSRLRQCGGPECGWLFLDRSRNRSRQWCTMEDCGNVSKVRRFRQRRRRRPRRTQE